MKRMLPVLAVAGVLFTAQRAWAVESRADVETDHVDATDDGGPRSAGFLLHPLAIATGWLGAEVDAACSDHVVLSVEGDALRVYGVDGLRASLGIAFFPQRFSFHGLYVHPTFDWARATAGGAAASALGGSVTVGYAWTWPLGATLRLGAGMGYAKGIARSGQVAFAIEGSRPQIDADLGWVF